MADFLGLVCLAIVVTAFLTFLRWQYVKARDKRDLAEAHQMNRRATVRRLVADDKAAPIDRPSPPILHSIVGDRRSGPHSPMPVLPPRPVPKGNLPVVDMTDLANKG